MDIREGFCWTERKKKTKSGWENVNCVKWELLLLFIYSCCSLSLFSSFHTYTLGITDETQAKWNNVLQILSQDFATFYLTICDFTFQPVFRYLNICDMYSIKKSVFFLTH